MYSPILKSLNQTVVKRKPIQSTQLLESDKFVIPKNLEIEIQDLNFGNNNHWVGKIDTRDGYWFFYKPHFDLNAYDLITWKHYKDCLPLARKQDLNTYFEPLNFAMAEFKINNLRRISAFLAQLAHESGSLRWKEELASGADYEGRKDLGNIYPGDGRRFKGRGPIQLTGRSNYQWATKELRVDLINNPLLAATDPWLGARIAGLYWHSRGLNNLADKHDLKSFRLITRRINGGYNGWQDRLNHWNRIRKVLYC